ncbi:hypothetical protein [Nostoc sp.]|uniref:hypothetical protein n=1 Tax=Nostoc sp. TaxID=1180 RepID=UPI002FF142A3
MSLDRIILFKNPPPDASKKSARPTIMLSGVFVNIVQSMTFAIATGKGGYAIAPQFGTTN